MNKKIIAVFMSAILFLNSFIHFGNILSKDVYAQDVHWAQKYLSVLKEYGIMRGDQYGNMNPDNPITRAEFVSMINRAFGYNMYYGSPMTFSDITGTEWYADDIAIAYSKGYFLGNASNASGAEDYLTREQAASLLSRNLKLEESIGEVLEFKDGRDFSNWSKGSIDAMAKKGYLNGYNDGTFRPFNNITRGEAAKIFADVIGKWISSSGRYTYDHVDGNVMIASSDTTLKNTVITGDLYITSGVGTGYVNLENVQVLGEVIISGGGESNAGDNSINFRDCDINKLVIDGDIDKVLSVDSYGNTIIGKTIVKTNAYLENYGDVNQGFVDIDFIGKEDSLLSLSGEFKKITMLAFKNNLKLGKGFIDELIIDEEAINSKVVLDRNTYISKVSVDAPSEISGLGDISTLIVGSNGVKVSMLPDEIIIRPGLTANINGKDMTSNDALESSSSPKILSGYPKTDLLAPTQAEFLYKTNKPGTIYWAITLLNDEELKKDELLKPKDVKRIVKSGVTQIKQSETETLSKITGLKVDTEYTLSALFRDERGQTSNIKVVEFRTVDNTIPGFNSGYPLVTSNSSSTLNIELSPTKDCNIYWAVMDKGAVAPTALELKNQEIQGSLVKGVQKRCEKNSLKVITAGGLKEKFTYDVYLLATDGENESNVIKLSGTTKDTTAPKFLEGYPLQDKITDKTIDVKVKVNEDSTVYWVALPKGTVFPAPKPGETVPPSLDSDEGKNAIITANNTFKSGKANVKADTEAVLKVTGLEAQTSYDFYVLAQDKALNASSGIKIIIKTLDNVPPTATQEFSIDINGEPKVDSDIKILFSEEVWNRNTNDPLIKETLKENISLYTMINGEEFLVDINYSMAEIGMDDSGKTYVNFPSGSIPLNSGVEYQFEINYIVDTSGNRMKDKTRLDKFKTVSPQVHLIKTLPPNEPNIDLTFKLSPQAIQTENGVLFDIIFESDTLIEFRLYEKVGNGEFVEITKHTDQPTPENKNKYATISENGATTFSYIQRFVNSGTSFNFKRFNQLTEEIEYGIQIMSVDGMTERPNWNKSVKMGIKCVIGAKTIMESLAGNPKDGLTSALKGGASLVHFPSNFEISTSFTDVVPPKFLPGYPNIDRDNIPTNGLSQVYDTAVTPLLKADKQSTFYYIIAPRGVVDPDITSLQIMSGTIRPEGGISGKYDIQSGGVEFSTTITGLKPETDYEMFYCLKGVPAEPSPKDIITFTTVPVTPPIITSTVINRGENMATIRVNSDKPATIDWMLMPSENTEGWFRQEPDGTWVIDESAISQADLANVIRNGEELGYNVKAYGSAKTKYDTVGKKHFVDLPIKGLERNIYYTFFAVAKMNLEDGTTSVGMDSKITFSRDVTSADVTPPAFTINTSIRNYAESHIGNPYIGDTIITFTEDIYYIDKTDNNKIKPLTIQAFKDSMKATGDDGDINIDGAKALDFEITDYKTRSIKGNTKQRALSQVKFKFKNVVHGSTITIGLELCDSSGNKSGYLKLVFEDLEPDRKNSKWIGEFIKEDQ